MHAGGHHTLPLNSRGPPGRSFRGLGPAVPPRARARAGGGIRANQSAPELLIVPTATITRPDSMEIREIHEFGSFAAILPQT